MKKEEIIAYFDCLAMNWDQDIIRNEKIINKILDAGGIKPGIRVLDVACGTGVLFSDYIDRNVYSVTGIDISPEMTKIALSKAVDSRINVICADAGEINFDQKFDCIMIYNAFPHFLQPDKLLSHLILQLNKGGRITVAHGMSREKIDAHHRGNAKKVSAGLMHENKLAQLLGHWVTVDTVVSDQEKYIVSGVLR